MCSLPLHRGAHQQGLHMPLRPHKPPHACQRCLQRPRACVPRLREPDVPTLTRAPRPASVPCVRRAKGEGDGRRGPGAEHAGNDEEEAALLRPEALDQQRIEDLVAQNLAQDLQVRSAFSLKDS